MLACVDAIAAEDTQHSRKLLQHPGLDTPLFALHEQNESEKSGAVLLAHLKAKEGSQEQASKLPPTRAPALLPEWDQGLID